MPVSPVERPSISVGGLRVDLVDLDAAAAAIVGPALRTPVHLCNAYTVSLASTDPDLMEALNRGGLNLIDGAPLMWFASRKAGRRIGRRPSGPDLMEQCLDKGRGQATRHYLFGSTPEVLDALAQRIEERWPGTIVAGAESPPFGDISDAALDEAVGRIRNSNADVVWVGLGTPKQDFEVDRMAARDSRTYVAIGAAFDFIAGTKKRAPQWMQKTGTEWVFRLLSEPRRLWKRYLVGNARFLWVLWKTR